MLLEKGFTGLKTGITPSAGPCLASSVKKDGFNLILIILNSKSKETRWTETKKLVSWTITKVSKIKDSVLKPQMKKALLKQIQHF